MRNSNRFIFLLSNREEIDMSCPSTPDRSPTPTASPSTVRKRPPKKVEAITKRVKLLAYYKENEFK